MSFNKDHFDLTYFGGVVKNADPEDIKKEFASASDNVDGSAPEGRLQGIPNCGNSISSTIAHDAYMSNWIKTSDAKWNLIYCNGTNTKIAKDFYGTLADSAVTSIPNATSFSVYNQSARIGVASGSNYFAGYLPYGHFSGSAHAWQSTTSALPQPVTVTNFNLACGGASLGNAFDAEREYQYAVSFVYDFVQESPISPMGANYLPISASNKVYNPILVEITNYASLPKRLTGVKLYRREVVSGTPTQTTFYRELVHLDVTNTVAFVDRTGTNQSWSTYYTTSKAVTFNDYNDFLGASYEDNTGIPETLTSTDVSYQLNTISGGYHFVAGCSKTSVPDAGMMLFRSKPYRFDTFDWSSDFLRLNTQPTALVSFQGRIWAFDENRTYRINPDSMIIEDITEGVGCLSQRSVVITDYGMFWCDYKNAYVHDGKNITPIGESIKSETSEWHGFARVETPIVVFDSQKNYVIFNISTSSLTTCNVWAYHVVRQRWDSWALFRASTNATMGMFTGKNGESYLADGTYLVATFGGATKKGWSWTSANFNYDNASVKKRFYKLSCTPSTNIKLEYSIDGASFVDNSTTALNKINGKKMRIRLSTSTSGAYVDSASHLYRPFEGDR